MRPLLAQPVFRALWRRMGPHYPNEITAFIDKLVAETPAIPPVNIVAQYKGDLAAEMSPGPTTGHDEFG